MRIIAGRAKGLSLKAPPDGTRPMTSRAKESLFSIIGNRLPEAVVLDLYAGSGSIGLEALSRGATSCVFVERGNRASKVLADNIDKVGLGGEVRMMSVETALAKLDGPFDLVFVDPPYAEDDRTVSDVLSRIEPLLAEGGLVVLHRQARSTLMAREFLTCIDERRYGDAVVTMMERSQT
ncbi:MAG: 16S rRNA (guanine(966)-N(2))-methyltransferase RsmD [Acidimicrobiia bacterium]